jgi:hypothetical protein
VDMNAFQWIELVRKSGVVSGDALAPWVDRCKETVDACSIASIMVDAQLLTAWQAKLLLMGKWKGFVVDHYCQLDQLEADNARGTRTRLATDKDTGSRVILEIIDPSRARTKRGEAVLCSPQGDVASNRSPRPVL